MRFVCIASLANYNSQASLCAFPYFVPFYVPACPVDEAPAWTLDQSVGLVFFFLLIGLYLSSSTLDKFVAKAQRRQLGLCEECGGLYDPTTCTEKSCPSRAQQ